MLYEIYGQIHKMLKTALRKNNTGGKAIYFSYVYEKKCFPISILPTAGLMTVNDSIYTEKEIFDKSDFIFKGENAVTQGCITQNSISEMKSQYTAKSFSEAWSRLLDFSFVESGWKNSGYCLTGYTKEKGQWVLSSWIWTSAAVCRCYCNLGRVERAKKIADSFLRDQLKCGGWIVRYDFTPDTTIPMVAPNDSAYIANNALLSFYKLTKDERYLNGAEKCAEWIMMTACPDGLPLIGMNANTGEWITKNNIVDIGFTAGLFANLYEVTGKVSYKEYLDKFIRIYIKLFWDKGKKAFYTSIDEKRKPMGGHFGRGQAWALEGLIPAYRVLKDEKLKNIIQCLCNYLCIHQDRNGGWAYNFSKPLMGQDCKGISVIANSLLEWYALSGEQDCRVAAQKALGWCERHTAMKGECIGGIFSYSVEGAVVHDLYTSTAFTYASAYALEIALKLKR